MLIANDSLSRAKYDEYLGPFARVKISLAQVKNNGNTEYRDGVIHNI